MTDELGALDSAQAWVQLVIDGNLAGLWPWTTPEFRDALVAGYDLVNETHTPELLEDHSAHSEWPAFEAHCVPHLQRSLVHCEATDLFDVAVSYAEDREWCAVSYAAIANDGWMKVVLRTGEDGWLISGLAVRQPRPTRLSN